MSLTQIINYDTPSNFTFDPGQIQVAAGHASLKLINFSGQTFSQNFSSSSGFIFDPTKTEFIGGVLRQKDTRPSVELFYARLISSANANWSNGSGTGAHTSQVIFGANGADFSASPEQYLDFDAISNVSSQVGAIRFRITPHFSGAPGATNYLLSTSAGNNNINGVMDFSILSNGDFNIRCFDANLSGIFAQDFGNIPWVAGTAYEIEFNYDLNTGESRLFVNGTQLGPTLSATGNRGPMGLIRLANYPVPQNFTSNLSIKDLEIFSTVQHTANYSSPSPLPNPTIYVSDSITFPGFLYPGLGSLVSFDLANISDANGPGYILNGKYWNGISWVVSDGSYAQSNLASVIAAHIGSLSAANTLGIVMNTQSSNTPISISLMSFGYTGQIYPTSNPTIVNNSGIEADLITAFASSFLAVGLDLVKLIVQINGFDTYWNGLAWVSSDGSYSQSNTVAEISANLSTLNLTGGALNTLKAFLHSSDGSSSPTLTSASLSYDFHVPPVTQPSKCIAYAFLNDLMGELGPLENATLTVELTQSFIYGNRMICAFSRVFNVDSNGYVETIPSYLADPDPTASEGIVETQTVNLSPYKFTVAYQSAGQTRTIQKSGVQIPNQLSVNLSTLMGL